MTLREDLADWRDWDQAARSFGRMVGVFDGATERQVSRVMLTKNPLGDGLHEAMLALVAAGVVERRDEPDEQFRWVFAGPDSLPGALEAWESDAKPSALSLPDLDTTYEAPVLPEKKKWWQRG